MATEAASAALIRTDQPRSTRRDLLEITVGYTLILATIWTANPTQRVLYWLAFAWIVATTWARRDGWTALGLGRKGLLQSLWVFGVALVLSAAMVFLAWRTHTLHRLHGPTGCCGCCRVRPRPSSPRPASSRWHTCPTPSSLPSLWCGGQSHASCFCATATSMPSDWPMASWASAWP